MRILIYRLGSLGDTVLALPCFHLIRQSYPEAEITVLTNAPVSDKAAPLESIVGSTGLVDHVMHYPLGLRDPVELWGLIARLRARKFDLLISLTAARGWWASVRDLLFFKACGIPRTMGIPFRHVDLACAMRPEEPLFESEAERLLRRVRPLGRVDLRERRWLDLRLTPEEKAQAERLLADYSVPGKFMAASLGTKWPLNDWGDVNWERLLATLSGAHPTLGLVLLGSDDEFDQSEKMLTYWAGPRANLCGKTSPRLSAAVLAKAAAFIGHDSGPLHLAAAAGTRCIAIFSARCPPGQWFPLGEGHEVFYPLAFFNPLWTEDAVHQRKALDSIRVETVAAAAEALLTSPPI